MGPVCGNLKPRLDPLRVLLKRVVENGAIVGHNQTTLVAIVDEVLKYSYFCLELRQVISACRRRETSKFEEILAFVVSQGFRDELECASP